MAYAPRGFQAMRYGYHGLSYGNHYYNNSKSRFVQFAENWASDYFSKIEDVVKAVSSISQMMESTFRAMTSLYRAILSVSKNVGDVRKTFGQIFHALNIFRLFGLLYGRLKKLLGFKGMYIGDANLAWKEAIVATTGQLTETNKPPVPWGALLMVGSVLVIPYFVNKFFMPKFTNTMDPNKWKVPGRQAVAMYKFNGATTNELSLKLKEKIIVAPQYIQDELKLTKTGWYFVVSKNKSGIVPKSILALLRTAEDPVLKKREDGAVKKSESVKIKMDPSKWKVPGRQAIAMKKFDAAAPNELSLKPNDKITVAPQYIQDEMNLTETGWYFAVSKDKSGIVPKNYLALLKTAEDPVSQKMEDGAVKTRENVKITMDPRKWKVPGRQAVAMKKFDAAAPNELSLKPNDKITVAPQYIQDEMNLAETGWYFAVSKGKSGKVPKNYLALLRTAEDQVSQKKEDGAVKRKENVKNNNQGNKTKKENKKVYKINRTKKDL